MGPKAIEVARVRITDAGAEGGREWGTPPGQGIAARRGSTARRRALEGDCCRTSTNPNCAAFVPGTPRFDSAGRAALFAHSDFLGTSAPVFRPGPFDGRA
jgi:hypothetical protein